jgi:hypothetical protein
MPKQKQLVDRRLLGTWKSDKRKTFRHFVPRPGAKPEGVRKLKTLFGKLVVRWTPTKCHTELDGCRESYSYELVDKDQDSVVLRCPDPLSKNERLVQIHFEGDHYWLLTWGNIMREYFRRIK